jgi:hypothetical protein
MAKREIDDILVLPGIFLTARKNIIADSAGQGGAANL